MRVLLITDWPALEGGTERYVTTLREGLEAGGDEVRLMTTSVGSRAGGTAEYVARGSDRRAAQALLQIANPSAAATIRSALRSFRPDAVHVAMFLPYLSPAVLAPLRSIPVTLAVGDPKLVCPNGMKMLPDGSQCEHRAGVVCWRGGCLGTARALRDAVRYRGLRALLPNVDHVLACSDYIEGELGRSGIDAQRLYLPVGAPNGAFRRRPAASPRFVYAGRLHPVKGVDLLLRAFARLRREHPNARLHISGDGQSGDQLVALADRLGLEGAVTFDRRRSRPWWGALEDAWALVAPSVYAEPLGLVAIEAQVRRVPVIASQRGGLGEIVEDGVSGLLFPNGDESALVDRMAAVCRRERLPGLVLDPAVTEPIVRRHDVHAYVREMHRIWRSLGA